MDLSNPLKRGWASDHERAEELGKHVRTIRNWCDQGLRYSKIGGTRLIHDDDLDAFFNANARGGNWSGR